MKKNYQLILGLLITIGMITSCNSSKKKELPEKLSPIQLKIDGDLSAHFTIVEDDYNVSDYSNYFYIKLERTDEALPDFSTIGVGIELFDKDGTSIHVQKPKLESLSTFSDFPISLLQLEPYDYGSLIVKFTDFPESIYGAEKFKITIKTNSDKKKKKQEKNKVSDTKKSNNNWDSVLNDYEKYIDIYVKLLKKAKSGDMSALTEYVSMYEKAESLETKLNNAKGELTPSQISRLNKANKKMINAAAFM